MGNYIGKVAAVFTANTSGLVAGTREATAALSKMQSGVSKISTGVNALVALQGAQMFAGLVSQATSAAGSLLSMADATAEVIDQQSKLARKIGVSLADFQSIALAADLAGVSQDKAANAIQKMGISISAADGGNRKALAAFQALGISLADIKKLSPADQFRLIAEKLSALPTPAEQAAKAVGIFGKGGKDMLDLFANGAKAVKDAAEYAELFGTALSNEAGNNVEAMKDNFTLIGEAIKGFKTQLVAAFAPAVNDQIVAIIDKIRELGGIKTVAQDTAIFLAEAAGSFIDAASVFASKIDTVLSALNTTVNAIGGIGSGFAAVGQRAMAGFTGIAAAANDIVYLDQRDPASMEASKKMWDGAEAWSDGARRSSAKADAWLYGTTPDGSMPNPGDTPGKRLAAATRAAVERENAAAAERERARQAAATATDSKKRDGLPAEAGAKKDEKTLMEQLQALKEVAANTAKQTVFKVFNITGAGAR